MPDKNPATTNKKTATTDRNCASPHRFCLTNIVINYNTLTNFI
jgi:hypothetical protein